jgi:hypothetical protein
MKESFIFKFYESIFLPKHGSRNMEGYSLAFLLLGIGLYVNADYFLLESVVDEIYRTDDYVSHGYYFGSAIGLFTIILIPTLVIVYLPFIGQKNPNQLSHLNASTFSRFSTSFGLVSILLLLADIFKTYEYFISHEYRWFELRLKALRIYAYLVIVFIVIIIMWKLLFTQIKEFISNAKKTESIRLDNGSLDISSALHKLEQIKSALDSGLIDEETFQEMKARLQERINKDI